MSALQERLTESVLREEMSEAWSVDTLNRRAELAAAALFAALLARLDTTHDLGSHGLSPDLIREIARTAWRLGLQFAETVRETVEGEP